MTHLTIDPKDATDTDLVGALCGLVSRIADVPSDPNGTQARDLRQMRQDVDQVRAEVLRRMGSATATDEAVSLRLDTSGPVMFGSEPQQWAVARLDSGAEVRMRACGGYVEIRTWDETETCNPPHLDVTRIGSHVIDVRVPGAADDQVFVLTTEQGVSESLGADQIQVLVNLGLIEHERDDHVMVGAGGRGIGPVHHFYRAARP